MKNWLSFTSKGKRQQFEGSHVLGTHTGSGKCRRNEGGGGRDSGTGFWGMAFALVFVSFGSVFCLG